MITEASPATIRPMPIPMSAKPWNWAISAPERATSPFESARPRSFWVSVFTPKERIMSGLSPVARIASPTSVWRNHTTTASTASATSRKMPTLTAVPVSPASRRGVIRVVSRSSGRLARPMMRRLMEYSPICVRIPASRPLMLPFVWSSPVTRPATVPATNARAVAASGCIPLTIPTAATAAPVVKLPSTVRSGKSRMRKVR